MTIVVDANIAIAVLDAQHQFHRAAARRCLESEGVAILNITHAEALIYPSREGKLSEATAMLDQMEFSIEVLDNDVADRARELRAEYGNRNFPMVDAAVVALGVERGWPVVTCDTKWPAINEADIQIVGPRQTSEPQEAGGVGVEGFGEIGDVGASAAVPAAEVGAVDQSVGAELL